MNDPQAEDLAEIGPLLRVKHRLRDELICRLYSVFHEISDHNDEHEMSSEDLNLWGLITSHPAVQNKLQAAINREKLNNTK